MTCILQGNLNRCRLSQDLSMQLAFEMDADLYIICEQYKNIIIHNWYSDTSGTASLWVRNANTFPVGSHGSDDGFVWIISKGVTFFSCYFSPNEPIGVFQAKLGKLEDTIRHLGIHVIVVGDFNAKSQEWGMTFEDRRGKLLADMIARLDLSVLISGNVTTFRRRGCSESIIDLTMVSPTVAAGIVDWKVLDKYTASDHQFIAFRFRAADRPRLKCIRKPRCIGWNTRKLNTQALLNAASRGGVPLEETAFSCVSRDDAENLTSSSMDLLKRMCDASMPKRILNQNKKPVYWWSSEIAALRSDCLKLRRKAQRSRRRPDYHAHNLANKMAKRNLSKAIKSSKRRCWQTLCDEVNDDMWGRGYQLVTRRCGFSDPVGLKNPTEMDFIVRELFPEHSDEIRPLLPTDLEPAPFSVSELRDATKTLSNHKAPGPDGIPNEVLKIVAEHYPYLLLNMYNSCILAGIFCSRWKLQKLVLLNKGRGRPDMPSSYRPLCMLDTAGKLYERLIRSRLRSAINLAGGFARQQYGFCVGKSTFGAIQEVVDAAHNAWLGNHRTRSICVLVTFDVKNAFNSVKWVDILNALHRQFQVPAYIRCVIGDYLHNRYLLYDTLDGSRTFKLSVGVAQGSVLGPDLWNSVYDDIFKMEIPENTNLVGFADDLAAIITARDYKQAKRLVEQITTRVITWLGNKGLQLATSKTEMVVLSRKRLSNIPLVARIEGNSHESVRSLRYLGIRIDTKLTYWSHICMTCDKALTKVG